MSREEFIKKASRILEPSLFSENARDDWRVLGCSSKFNISGMRKFVEAKAGRLYDSLYENAK